MKNLVAQADPSQQARILEQMGNQIVSIISDPYGNYAVTDIISSWPLGACDQIFESLHS